MKRLSYEEYCELISSLKPQIQKINYLPISNTDCAVLKDELVLKHTVGTNYQDDSIRYLIMDLMRIIKFKCK